MQILKYSTTLTQATDAPTPQAPGLPALAQIAAGTIAVAAIPSVAITGTVIATLGQGAGKEVISFTGTTGSLGAAGTLTGVQRGLSGTTQQNHNAGTPLNATPGDVDLVAQSEENRDVLNLRMNNNGTGTLTAAVVVNQIASIKAPYDLQITDVALVSANNVSGSAVIDIQVGTKTCNASGGVSSVGTGNAPTITSAVATPNDFTPASNAWSGVVTVPKGTYIYSKVTSVTSINDLRVEIGVTPN